MSSNKKSTINSKLVVVVFVLGGNEKYNPRSSYDHKNKEVERELEITEEGKVRRMDANYFMNLFVKSLKMIFNDDIAKDANVVTYERKVDAVLPKEFKIEQMPSINGRNLKQNHTMIYLVKSWVRKNYSWVYLEPMDKYLDGFYFNLNRSIFMESKFHKIIRWLLPPPLKNYKSIIVSN